MDSDSDLTIDHLFAPIINEILELNVPQPNRNSIRTGSMFYDELIDVACHKRRFRLIARKHFNLR
jgi:hypothetical protein